MRRTWILRHVRLSAVLVDMQTQGKCCASKHAPQVHWLAQVSAVLGDMEKTGGTISVSGSIAYVAQSAWIINDTVRGNITFGKPFDQARYDAVVEATSLEHDFKVQ